MKGQTYNVTRYDADDGMVFDWADLSQHTYEDEDGRVIQEHLFVKTIFIGGNDSISNYVEVPSPII